MKANHSQKLSAQTCWVYRYTRLSQAATASTTTRARLNACARRASSTRSAWSATPSNDGPRRAATEVLS